MRQLELFMGYVRVEASVVGESAEGSLEWDRVVTVPLLVQYEGQGLSEAADFVREQKMQELAMEMIAEGFTPIIGISATTLLDMDYKEVEL